MKAQSVEQKSRINIVLIEDHTVFRNGFALLLQSLDEKIHILFMAGDGEEFKEKLGTHVPPDLVITDIKMKGMNGFAVMNWMREYYPKIPVVALTMFNEAPVRDMARELGAKGLLLKGDENEILLHALHTVLAGGTFFSEPGPDDAVESYTEVNESSGDIGLTKAEHQFATLLLDDTQLKDIAESLHISVKTAERKRAD